MIYERPSPQDYEYESDYIEALERWQDYQDYKAYHFENDEEQE